MSKEVRKFLENALGALETAYFANDTESDEYDEDTDCRTMEAIQAVSMALTGREHDLFGKYSFRYEEEGDGIPAHFEVVKEVDWFVDGRIFRADFFYLTNELLKRKDGLCGLGYEWSLFSEKANRFPSKLAARIALQNTLAEEEIK